MSHARQGFVAAALGCLFATQAWAEPAVVDSKLNLRSGPGPAFAVIAVVPPGTKLDAQKCTDEWCRVKLGRQIGYVSRSLLKIGADSFASAEPYPTPARVNPKPMLAGPHVWKWNDSEWRDRQWRRLDWHNRMNQR